MSKGQEIFNAAKILFKRFLKDLVIEAEMFQPLYVCLRPVTTINIYTHAVQQANEDALNCIANLIEKG